METENRFLRKFGKCIFITFFCLIIFQGCGTKEAVKTQTDEDFLRQRVTAYWDYKIKQEFDKTYDFEVPVYRKKVSLVNYIRSFRTNIVKWIQARIENIKIEDGAAMLDLTLRVRVKLPEVKSHESDSLIKEKWVKVEGIWYHVPGEL